MRGAITNARRGAARGYITQVRVRAEIREEAMRRYDISRGGYGAASAFVKEYGVIAVFFYAELDFLSGRG